MLLDSFARSPVLLDNKRNSHGPSDRHGDRLTAILPWLCHTVAQDVPQDRRRYPFQVAQDTASIREERCGMVVDISIVIAGWLW